MDILKVVDAIRMKLAFRQDGDDINLDASWKTKLPYGLCKDLGIDTKGMTPREAWDAWINETGGSPKEAMASKSKASGGLKGPRAHIKAKPEKASTKNVYANAITETGDPITAENNKEKGKKYNRSKNADLMNEQLSDGKWHDSNGATGDDFYDYMSYRYKDNTTVVAKKGDDLIEYKKVIDSYYKGVIPNYLFEKRVNGKKTGKNLYVNQVADELAEADKVRVSKHKNKVEIKPDGTQIGMDKWGSIDSISWPSGKVDMSYFEKNPYVSKKTIEYANAASEQLGLNGIKLTFDKGPSSWSDIDCYMNGIHYKGSIEGGGYGWLELKDDKGNEVAYLRNGTTGKYEFRPKGYEKFVNPAELEPDATWKPGHTGLHKTSMW